VKATYLLHIFPLLSILAGEVLTRIYEKKATVYYIIMALIALVFLHNLPIIIVSLRPYG
jgi:hypothetical protein